MFPSLPPTGGTPSDLVATALVPPVTALPARGAGAALSSAERAALLQGPAEEAVLALKLADHLTDPQKREGVAMMERLRSHGILTVPDTPDKRHLMVAGVQWAWEQVAKGPEFIITPQLATPLRTRGEASQPEAQRVRAEGLVGRMVRGDPLHLVFSADGAGTPMERERFRQLQQEFKPSGTLVAYRLSLPQRDFPAVDSGAILFFGHRHRSAFAIKANQANQADPADRGAHWPTLSLFLDPLPALEEAPGQGPCGVPDRSLAEVVHRWDCFLQDQDPDAWRAFRRAQHVHP